MVGYATLTDQIICWWKSVSVDCVSCTYWSQQELGCSVWGAAGECFAVLWIVWYSGCLLKKTPLNSQWTNQSYILFFLLQSDSHQSSYSPQPQQFPQNSSQPASINQTQPQSISQSKHVPQPQQGAQPPHQVQLPLFNFPQSPPGQYSTLHNLGLLQMHHHHQIQLPNTSWPIHGPVIHSAPGNPPHSTNVPFSMRSGSSSTTNNQSSVSLNDPSIIFAQPAARPMGIPSTSHEGHWHNPVTPNSLVNNGTVGNSGNSSLLYQTSRTLCTSVKCYRNS